MENQNSAPQIVRQMLVNDDDLKVPIHLKTAAVGFTEPPPTEEQCRAQEERLERFWQQHNELKRLRNLILSIDIKAGTPPK